MENKFYSRGLSRFKREEFDSQAHVLFHENSELGMEYFSQGVSLTVNYDLKQ